MNKDLVLKQTVGTKYFYCLFIQDITYSAKLGGLYSG